MHWLCMSIVGYREDAFAIWNLRVLQASPNNIHNSEKLRNRFWSGSAILIVALLYVSCKNPHPQSKFTPIALYNAHQVEALSFFFSDLLKKFYLFFGILAAFYKFHWSSKLYATLIMGYRFLGVQISIKTVTLL